MNAWSNIQASPGDQEIQLINKLEERLGQLPPKVSRIRELITRFEVCHFKYQKHLEKIRASIRELEPGVDPADIGRYHIQHGEWVAEKDPTGRSLLGQNYVWAMKEWLSESRLNVSSGQYDPELGSQIHQWLGSKNPEKERLVKLLIARLTWDWRSYEKLQQGEAYKELEFQLCRMDICHYAFPENVNEVLKGLGQMKALDESRFSGCGSFNAPIKNDLEKEFISLNDSLKAHHNKARSDKDDLYRLWLMACLAKTIKENIKITTPITEIEL